MKTRQLTIAAAAALLAALTVLVAAPAASANPPVITRTPTMGPFTFTVNGVCPFEFTDNNYITDWTEIDYFDNNGNLTVINFDFFSSDTYVGPTGTTLVNSGVHFHARMVFDSNGNVISDYGEGVIERVALPDGSTFFAAGRADFLAHGSQPIYLPDWGGSRNLAGFCAALGG
jgi:hypothetical protein